MTTSNTTSSPATGPSSTSFWAAASGLAVSVLVVVLPYVTHKPADVASVSALVGGLGALGTVVVKLWHDVQRHKLAAAVPVSADALEQAQKVLGTVLTTLDAPGGLVERVGAIENKVGPVLQAAQTLAAAVAVGQAAATPEVPAT